MHCSACPSPSAWHDAHTTPSSRFADAYVPSTAASPTPFRPYMELTSTFLSWPIHGRLLDGVLQLAQRLKHKEHIFLLGKGYGEPIAYEGALKLKEMAYIHAEGYRSVHAPLSSSTGPLWVACDACHVKQVS